MSNKNDSPKRITPEELALLTHPDDKVAKVEEVFDPSHLSSEEIADIDETIMLIREGFDVTIPDDPIERGLINGRILSDKFCYDIDEENKDKIKLLDLTRGLNFDIALQAAKELDPQLQLPRNVRRLILEELKKLSPERAAEICTEMERPKLVIVPSNTFCEKVKQINNNQHYENQDDIEFPGQDHNDPYRYVVKIDKVRICIVEGIAHPKNKKNAPSTFNKRRKYEIQRLANKKMKLIGPHEMATLLQQSLIEAEKMGNSNVIVDNSEDDKGTITILNPEELADSSFVAYHDFGTCNRCAYFDSDKPDLDYERIRVRALVQVLEF